MIAELPQAEEGSVASLATEAGCCLGQTPTWSGLPCQGLAWGQDSTQAPSWPQELLVLLLVLLLAWLVRLQPKRRPQSRHMIAELPQAEEGSVASLATEAGCCLGQTPTWSGLPCQGLAWGQDSTQAPSWPLALLAWQEDHHEHQTQSRRRGSKFQRAVPFSRAGPATLHCGFQRPFGSLRLAE